jgi:F-type H+-transporting ATPase subunit epsilon
MANTFEIEIVTPEQPVYKGTIQSVMVPGSDGLFQILYNHAPIISTLGTGDIRMGLPDGNEKTYKVAGGVIEVMNNKAIVLVEKILEGKIQRQEEK